MNSSLREQFARLGPIQEVGRVPSGSPAVLSLRASPVLAEVKTVSAAIALARRGVSPLKAKRALEEMLSKGRSLVHLPTVEDASALAAELVESGIRPKLIASDAVDVKAVREKLGLTQEQFALRYGLDIRSVQNWEANRRKPDAAVRSYLRVIEHFPERASEALEVDVVGT